MMKKLFTLIVALATFTLAGAWESDTDKNDLITPEGIDIYGYDIQTNCHGMTYVFYQTPRSGGITMRLQILDRDGRKTLGNEGIIVSDEANSSSTVVNQLMMVDREGNAIIPVSDWRAGSRQPLYTVYKVNEQGQTLWSTTLNNGVVNGSLANMQVVQVADGGYVLAYFRYGGGAYYITLEKLSADGESLWIRDVYEEGVMYSYPYLVDATDGNVMLIYAVGTSYDLTARLIDADGNDAWEQPLTFYTGGFSPIRAIQTAVNVKPAPDGGALVAWMHIDGTYFSRMAWIRNDGSMAFDTDDGSILISNENTLSRYLPDFCYDDAADAIYAVYRQFNQSKQEYQGIYMQKISPTGQLLWGDTGLPVVAMQEESQVASPSIKSAGEGRVAVFHQSLWGLASEGPVGSYMTLFDGEGQMVQEPVNFSTNDDTKSALATSPLLDGNHFLASWKVSPTSSTTLLYMQYVNTDGTTDAIDAQAANGATPTLLRQDCFTIDGRPATAAAKGVILQRLTTTDCTVTTRKVLRK